MFPAAIWVWKASNTLERERQTYWEESRRSLTKSLISFFHRSVATCNRTFQAQGRAELENFAAFRPPRGGALIIILGWISYTHSYFAYLSILYLCLIAPAHISPSKKCLDFAQFQLWIASSSTIRKWLGLCKFAYEQIQVSYSNHPHFRCQGMITTSIIPPLLSLLCKLLPRNSVGCGRGEFYMCTYSVMHAKTG